MNKVILIGNLTANPEAFTTQGGKTRSTFRLAVQRRYANATGVREADFLTVVAWNQTAEFCNRYLLKGRRVAVEGSIQVRSYDAQDGSKRYVTEIIAESVEALWAKDEGAGDRPHPSQPAAATPVHGPAGPVSLSDVHRTSSQALDAPKGEGSGDFTEVEDDDLPF